MKSYQSLAAVFWVALLLQPLYVYGACNLGSIEIKQSMLEEKWEEGDMMRATYSVSITNSACLPYNVVLWCPGWPSTQNLSFMPNTVLSAFFVAGRDLYMLNEGEALAAETLMGFNYTVTPRGIQTLPPTSLQIPIILYSADFFT